MTIQEWEDIKIKASGVRSSLEPVPPVTPASAVPAKDIFGMDKEINIIKKAIEHNEPVLLEGETGAGKTYLVLTLAKQMGKDCIRLCLNGEFGVTELLGRPTLQNDKGTTITGWQDGLLVKAMKQGSWVILDEINMALPEVLTVLNSLLDDSREITLAENKGEVIKPHAGFRVFATMNPADGYIGTKELNPALKSRFTCHLFIDYPDNKTELEIIKAQTGLEESLSAIIVDCANALRTAKRQGTITLCVGVRDCINWAKVAKSFNVSLQESFEISIVNKARQEEKQSIIDIAKNAIVDLKLKWSNKSLTVGRKLTEAYSGSIQELEKRIAILQDTIKQLSQLVKAEV